MQLRSGTPQEAGLSAQRVAHVAMLAANWVAQGLTPALAVLVARRGIVVLHEAFGRLTPAADAPPLARDTLFPLASVTKPITATAVMMLVEEGLLSLNRPVTEYIPEFSGEGKQAVMVHHLLTHTSGLLENEVWPYIDKRSQAVVQIPPPAQTQDPKLNEYLFLGYDAPLWKPPGVEMSYCSYGYDLLGEIVRRVSGKALADFARERIFVPLGMKDSWYSVPDSLAHRIVQRPPTAVFAELDSPVMIGRPPFIRSLLVGLNSRELQELPYPAGGVYSTVMDMATFGQMFLNRGRYGDMQLLSLSTVAAMTRNQIAGVSAFDGNEFFPEASWGFGWDVRGDKNPMYEGTLCSPATFSHSGIGGIYLWVDPVYEIVGVYFSVTLRTTADSNHKDWQVDLFQNAVTATICED